RRVCSHLRIYDEHASLVVDYFFNHAATTYTYSLSLHDALPISDQGADGYLLVQLGKGRVLAVFVDGGDLADRRRHAVRQREDLRSEEHTSELQSRENLVCRLLLEKKKI